MTATELRRPIVPLTVAFVVAAVGVWFLPAHRDHAWGILAFLYAVVATWGTVSIRSGIFGKAHHTGDPASGRVALTFDDGPDPAATPAILDLLAARGVKATFFCVGERVCAHPEVVTRCQAEGHALANHSHRHRALTNLLFGGGMRREMTACQEALFEVTGERPRYYRPPMGLMNHAVVGAAEAHGLELVGWQARGLDTTARPAAQVVARILRAVKPGGIVLLHDGAQDPTRAVAITAGVLDGLTERGLKPVRVDELLGAAS